MYALCSRFFAILGTGLVVKTMDDLLDEKDISTIPYLRRLGPGVMAYTMAIFSLAFALNFKLAFGLFWASYSVGMLHSPEQNLPTHLKAGIETILGLALILIIVGIFRGFWSLFIIGAVHLADDLLDYEHDRKVKAANVALLLGPVECFLFSLILLYISLSLFPLDSIFVWALALLIGNSKIFQARALKP